MAKINRKIILNERPRGLPTASTFKYIEEPVPEPGPGQLLVKARYISVDPYMRNRMNNVKSYIPPYELNEVISGDVLGEILISKAPGFKPGDMVAGILGWQEYTIALPEQITRFDSDMIPESVYLSALGLTGLTAYFGLQDIGKPVNGESVVISGAAGAVGSIAGQIAKIRGCRVVGITGSDEKAKYLKAELGFEAAINYKNYGNLRKPLKQACPDGVDIYFDNVGGEISDSVLYLLNDHSRIVLCGQIALYNLSRMDRGPRLQPQLLIHRTLMKGFNVYDYRNQFDDARSQIAHWLINGKLKSAVNLVKGFENIPDAFLGLFRGDNIGKQLVKVD